MALKSNPFDGALASGSSGYSTKGWDWDSIIGAGASIVGGLINSRGARSANQMTLESNRENIRAGREMNRENIRAQMQREQDEYARTVTRGRRAISPYRQMYSGPSFQFAEGQGPDAPIYNPLMEAGSMYNQLGQAPVMPWDKPSTPTRR